MIFLKNFKAHEELTLELKKFTILIGPNSSGKSTILQSILILKRMLTTPDHDLINLITKLNLVDLGEFKDIVTFGDTGKSFSIQLVGSKNLEHGVEEDYKTSSSFGYKMEYDKVGLKEVILAGHIDDVEYCFDWKRDRGPNAHAWLKEQSLKLHESTLQGFHPIMRIEANTNLYPRFNSIFSNGSYTRRLLEDFHYVPFFRVATKYGETLVRFRDDFLLSEPEGLIRHLMSNLSKEPKLLILVSKLMEQLIGKSIQARPLDLAHGGVEHGITLDFIKDGFRNSITNEGTGSNQAILLLSVLAGTKSGSVIAIDEPEIHLHPKGQTKLAKIMIELGKSQDKQLIFATHSEHMIYPFLNAIATKLLSPNEVAIYYFDRNDSNNLSKVEQLPINEQGQLVGGLKGFWDADLESFFELNGDKK
jgi:energy-coupling factor transporter ATP-binding protein EcfA2